MSNQIVSIPNPPENAFSHYFRLIEKKTSIQVLRLLASEKVAENIDPKSISLPKKFASDIGLGESAPCSEETAKNCKAYLEFRSVPRHKIPKVGMGSDANFALRSTAAREAKLQMVEAEMQNDPNMHKLLNTKVREAAAVSWKESKGFDSSIYRDMLDLAKRDISRYHEAMHDYYKSNQCECAQQKKCRGTLCLCECYFCASDRTHSKHNRCACSRTHRYDKAWQGAVEKKDKQPNAQQSTANYRKRPETTCNCVQHKNCAIIGCDCYCGYCLREKALHVVKNKEQNKEYCPCKKFEICQDAKTCFCRCYKCSEEKVLMGICPFRPPQVV